MALYRYQSTSPPGYYTSFLIGGEMTSAEDKVCTYQSTVFIKKQNKKKQKQKVSEPEQFKPMLFKNPLYTMWLGDK